MQSTTTLKRLPAALVAIAMVILIIAAIVLASGALNIGRFSPATVNSSVQPTSSLDASRPAVTLSGADIVDVTVAGNRER